MGLDATPRSAWLASHAPGAWLASPRVRLLAALAVAYLLGVWSATSSSAGVAQGAAAAVVACASGPGAESAAAEALGDSAAQPIVDDAALVPVTEEDVMAVEAAEQPEPTAEPAEPAEPVGAPAAAPAAAVAPRHVAPPRKSVVKLRGTITCSALRALRARFIAYLTVPNMVPGIKTAVMNIIGQLDAEVLLPLIGDLFDRSAGVMMFDIGANAGQTSSAMMSFVCDGNCSRASACAGKPRTGVVAFEPQRAMFQSLTALAKRESWGVCGWQARNAAVSVAPGTMELFGGNTHASLGKKAAWMDRADFGENKVEQVRVTTVDKVVEELGLDTIFLLKIDTEGYDTMVVQGASQTLARKVPRFVLAEYNTKWFDADERSSLRRFVRRMQVHGYLCYVFTARNLVPLTGFWWHPALEYKRWSNILCAQRGDPALELLLRRINTIYAPPTDRCVDGGREMPDGDGADAAEGGA